MIIANIVFRSLLAKGEKIHYVAHVHPFTVYPILFRSMFFGLLIPLGFYFLMPPLFWFWVSWFSIGFLLFMYRVIQWYLDAWIITNYGIIDQDWVSFFNKTVTRIEYGNIEGVTSEVKGFWATIMSYGNIQIEHLSGTNVVLKNVTLPRKIESKVLNYQQAFKDDQTFNDHSKLKDLLTTLLRNG